MQKNHSTNVILLLITKKDYFSGGIKKYFYLTKLALLKLFGVILWLGISKLAVSVKKQKIQKRN
ncbi:hypothetical protein FLACHUCJ7_03630 [Flavobacterium chungangense]|uniref:Uncharacterized protein n=1 Tax=Flavobacterium chungangense TaxID=554283 RepID=A0A6V6Z8H9_9FLAO|nr:hypothetical protein FLACHUCJ7_03630 [Flavobacterium chungangense]